MRLLWVLDCADPDTLADFWAAALRFDRRPYTPPYARVYDPSGRWPDLLLQRVPEGKAAKNRMHLDLQVLDVAPEVARLEGLGARVLSPAHDDAGYLTAILADPEGNEFCVIAPPEGSRDRERVIAASASGGGTR